MRREAVQLLSQLCLECKAWIGIRRFVADDRGDHKRCFGPHHFASRRRPPHSKGGANTNSSLADFSAASRRRFTTGLPDRSRRNVVSPSARQSRIKAASKCIYNYHEPFLVQYSSMLYHLVFCPLFSVFPSTRLPILHCLLSFSRNAF